MRGERARDRVLVVWCPDSPGEEGSAGPRALAAALAEFSPRVTALDPQACAFPARGPARYFGGEEALAGKILEALAARDLSCRVGVADGRFAAELAARAARGEAAGQPGSRGHPGAQVWPGSLGQRVTIVLPGESATFLARYPVSVLDDPVLADLLPRLGLHTLGDFAALPPADAASRFGPRGALAHRLARGLDPRPLVPSPPAADLSVSQEFDPPEPQAEVVVFAAKALAGQMHAALAARGLACVRVRARVVFSGGGESSRTWRHDGLLSALAVAERVRWQLSGWSTQKLIQNGSPAPDAQAGGISLLRLEPEQLVRATGRQLGLWGDSVVSDRVARVALRAQAMLGHDAVTRPVLSGGRNPSDQVAFLPFGESGEPRFSPDLPPGPGPGRLLPGPWPGRLPPPAPATVYPAPIPATVSDASGAPVTVSGRAVASASPAFLAEGDGPLMSVTGWAGPWPVTERWWDPARATRKARFQLVTEDGRAWLAAVQGSRWLIEAAYG